MNKTEDRFYFGKPGRKAKFDANAPWMSEVNRMLRDLSRERAKIQIWISGSDSVTTAGSSRGSDARSLGTTWLVAGRIAGYLQRVPGAVEQHTEQKDYPKKGLWTSFYKVSNLPKELVAYLKNWGIGTSPKSFSGFTGTSAVAYSRPGQPERFAISVSDLNYAKSQIRSASPERLREIEKELLPLAKSGDNNANTLLAYLKQEWDERYRSTYSRPGQPERFGLEDACWEGYEPVGTKQKDGRTVPNCVPKAKNEQPEEFGSDSPRIKAMESQLSDWIKQRDLLLKDIKRNPNDERAQRNLTRVRQEINALVTQIDNAKRAASFSRPGQPERFEKEYVLWGLPKGETDRLHEKVLSTKAKTPAQMDEIKRRAAKDGWHSFRVQILDLSKPYTGFSRPGQPDKFDASSLDRGNFAEASTSPMLGKLLSEKVMPEGGWRAVETGGGALVISFEDADLARDFGRRAASKGYNATSPVQAIGRYWNVEVKNG